MTPPNSCAARGAPSPWIVRWSHLLQSGGSVLDVACGGGRHASWLAERGHAVTAVDRDLSGVGDLSGSVSLVQADIENAAWPLLFNGAPIPFNAVVVTNYLWRPLFPTLVNSVAPGGVLLYETFAQGNETVGRPARPEFLLRHGELLQMCHGLHIVAFEDGYQDAQPRYVQRIAAVRKETAAPALYTL